MGNPTPLPLPMQDADYTSRKSRAVLSNMMVQVNQSGDFRAIVKREGSIEVGNTITQVTSTMHMGDSLDAFFCDTDNYYRITGAGAVSSVGAKSISTSAFSLVASNNKSTGAEYLFPFQSGAADVFTFPGGATAITDVDYTSHRPSSWAQLGGRIYAVSSTSGNQFIASNNLDALTWDALAFATADEITGRLIALAPNKSSMWVMCSQNIELWQIFNDPVFPLRRVQGASQRIGVLDPLALDQLLEWTGFVGDDHQVYLIDGAEIRVISDIDFAQKITNLGDVPLDFYAAFIDGPDHKYFCVTSAPSTALDTLEFTWVYDLKTGQSHYRQTNGLGYWHLRSSAYTKGFRARGVYYSVFRDRINPITDNNVINELDPNLLTDNGDAFTCTIQTGSVSYPHDVTIESIEVEMETGVGNVDSPNPVMGVEYSKDGGVTWSTWGDMPMGADGDYGKRIIMNSFGRLVRYTDFVLRLTVTEPVKWEVYGISAQITRGF